MDIPLRILYEDDDILAVDKPTNMPTHPSKGNNLPTLANAVMGYYGGNFVFRSVNRLDRDTSGIVIIAKNRMSAYALSDSMKKGLWKKKYNALVEGVPNPIEATIDAPIERIEEGNIKRTVREDGKRAITKYKVAVFVDGEFWHGENWEERKSKLKANREYWIEKIEENIARDKRNDMLLQEMGWIPVHFWEKEIKKDLEHCVHTVIDVVQARFSEMIEI
jgi:hypothetical protein